MKELKNFEHKDKKHWEAICKTQEQTCINYLKEKILEEKGEKRKKARALFLHTLGPLGSNN